MFRFLFKSDPHDIQVKNGIKEKKTGDINSRQNKKNNISEKYNLPRGIT